MGPCRLYRSQRGIGDNDDFVGATGDGNGEPVKPGLKTWPSI